jgi:Polyprenyltransferase (cytochrome oxidase assembly factor)
MDCCSPSDSRFDRQFNARPAAQHLRAEGNHDRSSPISASSVAVVIGVRSSARCIRLASLALAGFTGLFLAASGAHVVLGLAVALMLGSVWLVRAPSGERAWTLFEFMSPYLALVFALLAVNAWITG